jgi:tetratricopeptide repeat protein
MPLAIMNAKARTIAASVLLGLATTSAAAGADGPKAPTKANIEDAQRRFQHGRDLYEENDFQGALVEFQRAYDLAPNYKLLYDIAQVQYQLQDYPGALRTFNKYLAEGKGDIPAQRREEVQKEIERLRARVASVSVTVNMPGAEVLVDDVPMGKAPLAEPVLVSVGHRKISATLAGHPPATRFIDVAGMDSVSVNLEIYGAGAGGAASAGGEGKAPGFPWAPWAITGGLGVAAIVTGGLALKASSDLNTALDTFGTTRADLDAASGRTKAFSITTDVLLGATAVAAGVSLYLTLSRRPQAEGSTAAALPPVHLDVGPGSVVVRGVF